MKGDIDGNLIADLADAIFALQDIVRLNPVVIRTEVNASSVDVNGDGKIGMAEGIYILQKAAGIRRVVAKDKSTPIYVYCRSGRRSQIAKETLKKMGYENVRNLGSIEDSAKTMKLKIIK